VSPSSSAPRPRLPWHLLVLGSVALLYLLAGAAWLHADLLVFDGDEAGHVGAAELFAAMWREGRAGQALWTTFAGSMGVYPPLYAGAVGAWWALLGSGEPTRVAVQGVNLLGPVLAALAVHRLARSAGRWPAVGAAVAVLALPLLCGLGRHFMIEGALAAVVAWAVVALEGARARPTPARLALLGLAVGLAYLCKQTALLYLLPVILLRVPRRPASLAALVAALAVATPWTLLNLGEQFGYGSESAAGTPGIGLLWHAVFYPWSVLWVAVGPALLLLAGLGVVAGLRAVEPERRTALWLALAWLVGSVVLLMLVPRKYPRLLAPALPAVGLLVALALARWRRGWQGAGVLSLLVLALGWVGWGSLRPLPVPASARVLDDRCPQIWLRPPVADDLGLAAVVDAVRHSRPGPVRIVGTAEIPCGLQTTHDWSSHVGPALRYAGVDRELITEPDDERAAALVISWEGPMEGYRGEVLPVPALDGEIWIGRPGR
jgi:hypothetical protein